MEDATCPKNMHDLSKARMSYSIVATNLENMIPKSMVNSCIGFADHASADHLKIQQAIAKAKPDGMIIDIEGWRMCSSERVVSYSLLTCTTSTSKLASSTTGVRTLKAASRTSIREINNSVRNINEFIALYNHYLRMIRDATGINEAMDGTTPKGEQLVGVRQQAIAAGNNAIYDITNSSMLLFKKGLL